MRNAILILLTLGLTGCGLDILTTTAITGELQKREAERATGTLERAEQQTERWEVQQAVRAYRAEHGRNPDSLEELVPEYLAEVPTNAQGEPMAYNPATGQVFDREGEGQRLARLRQAIQEYAQERRHYPPNLRALTPQYLSEIPRTEGGESFAYNPQTGAVVHPRQLRQQQGNQRPGGRQQPTYNQPGAGGNVGVYGRESIRGIEREHNQRQQQALDELGF